MPIYFWRSSRCPPIFNLPTQNNRYTLQSREAHTFSMVFTEILKVALMKLLGESTVCVSQVSCVDIVYKYCIQCLSASSF